MMGVPPKGSSDPSHRIVVPAENPPVILEGGLLSRYEHITELTWTDDFTGQMLWPPTEEPK